MRQTEEMLDLILSIAREDERIRGVYLNGSRANPNVTPDIFQDYDVVYMVTETKSFREDRQWLDVFGERLYMQCPEAMDAEKGDVADLDNCYGYLMQHADGNRIDLHLQTLELCRSQVVEDKLTTILLDKDQVLPQIPPATDEDYWVTRPTEVDYRHCCNEFWWCLNNVAKGMWREEALYVMDMLGNPIRPQLLQMLAWYVGNHTNYSVSIGKSGKYIQHYLPEKWWQAYKATYTTTEKEALWQGIDAMCELFDEVAREVGASEGFTYNQEEATNSRCFLENAKKLPKDASEVL